MFIAYHGRDKRLWFRSTGDDNRVPVVMERLETKHRAAVSSLAISADNGKVFSSELDANCKYRIIIHDTKT